MMDSIRWETHHSIFYKRIIMMHARPQLLSILQTVSKLYDQELVLDAQNHQSRTNTVIVTIVNLSVILICSCMTEILWLSTSCLKWHIQTLAKHNKMHLSSLPSNNHNCKVWRHLEIDNLEIDVWHRSAEYTRAIQNSVQITHSDESFFQVFHL